MANEMSTHVSLNEEVRQLINELAVCREPSCPVAQKHPRYPVPETPSPLDFLDGPVGCMPVVPTWLQTKRIMILGMYPTCRFATIGSEQEVPIRDIDEPFENSRYYDGSGIRNVRSGTVLYEDYLEPLGLKPEDLWITNLVKCFLFKPEHVKAYQKINWPIPDGFEATRENGTEQYFEAAKPCLKLWLSRELALCQPRLVIALGSFVCRMIHADAAFTPAKAEVWGIVRGKLLPAGIDSSGAFKRHELFQNVNLFCLYHPNGIRQNSANRRCHLDTDLPNVKQFLAQIQ